MIDLLLAAIQPPVDDNPIPPSGGALVMQEAKAAAPGLPYSPVVEAGGVIYLAGHLGRDPKTKELSGEIGDETRHALRAISATLATIDANLKDVVRCQVFLDDIGDYAGLNAAYASFFPVKPPARTTVAVEDLPLGAKVEIQCTAVRGRGAETE